MNIASLLAAAPDPHRPALIFSEPCQSVVTFGELDDRSSRLAAGLHDSGLNAGDRAIVLAPISLQLYCALIALFRLGVAAVFLDPQAGYRQLEHAALLADAKAFFGTSKTLWLKFLSPALRGIPLVVRTDGDGPDSLSRLAGSYPPRAAIADVEPETPALITFTGGTTDSAGPRGVLRTHRLLIAQHAAIARAFPVGPSDVDLPAFPMVTLHNLAAGITSVIPNFPFRRPKSVRPERILHQIKSLDVTTASGSPAYWLPIAQHCLSLGLTLPLRRILVGGAPVGPGLMRDLTEVAPHAEVFSVYGSTEAEPVAVMSAREVLAETSVLTASGSGIPLGQPVSDIGIRIQDTTGNEQGVGQPGEIWVTGGHVARRYFANPQADELNKRLDAEGRLWHRMDDLGYRDECGRLWLAGRANTVVVRDGCSIYPVQVEAMVGMLPFVRRAALTGLDDPYLGELLVLTIEFESGVPKPTDWQSQVRTLCAERGWTIDGVRSVRRIPVDTRHNARIDYRQLKSGMRGS